LTNRAPLEEFDPAKLQDGLLMAVENVHERLREAREKHRVMIGNPVTETSAENIDVAGVTVLGYDECHTVLTDPDRFSSSIYEHIMGPVMGRTLLEKEGSEHHEAGPWCRRCSGRSCSSGGAPSWSRWWCMS
jgi:cytochrome P450